jgi:hypothetical protein
LESLISKLLVSLRLCVSGMKIALSRTLVLPRRLFSSVLLNHWLMVAAVNKFVSSPMSKE